jgi:hypothetical protein
MSNPDHDYLIREAEEALAEARAEVQRLREQLAAEQKNDKRLTTAAHGIAEARRRVAQRAGRIEKPEKGAEGSGDADSQPTGAAAGIAAARARGYGR